jgi:hypothetical protein
LSDLIIRTALVLEQASHKSALQSSVSDDRNFTFKTEKGMEKIFRIKRLQDQIFAVAQAI